MSHHLVLFTKVLEGDANTMNEMSQYEKESVAKFFGHLEAPGFGLDDGFFISMGQRLVDRAKVQPGSNTSCSVLEHDVRPCSRKGAPRLNPSHHRYWGIPQNRNALPA